MAGDWRLQAPLGAPNGESFSGLVAFLVGESEHYKTVSAAWGDSSFP